MEFIIWEKLKIYKLAKCISGLIYHITSTTDFVLILYKVEIKLIYTVDNYVISGSKHRHIQNNLVIIVDSHHLTPYYS